MAKVDPPWWEDNDPWKGVKQLGNAIKHLFVGYNKEEEKKVVHDYEVATQDSIVEQIIKNWLPLSLVAVLLYFAIKK